MITQAWVAFKICAIMYLAGYAFAWLARPAEARWVKSRPLPLMAGLFAVGMLSPSVWFVYIAIAASIPLLARSRAEAAALYIAAMLALPRLDREIGFAGIYLFAFDKWLMGMIGMAIACARLPAVPSPGGRRWFDVPFVLVILLEAALARGGNLTGVMRTETLVLLCYIVPYYQITRSLRRPEDVRLFLVSLCFVGFVMAAIAVFEARTTFLPFDAIDQRLGGNAGGGYVHQRSGRLRAHASLGDATVFGLFLARALIGSLPLRDSFRSRRYWLAAIGVIAVGLYFTNSRGPLLAVLIGLVCYDLYRKRYQSLSIKLGLMTIAYATALMAAQFSQSIAERMGVSGDSKGNSDYRHMLFDRGVQEIRKHPFSGVSVPQTYADLADLRQGEGLVDFVNGYIFYGMVTGVIGVAMLAGSFLLTAAGALRSRARLAGDPQMVATGAVVFSVALMTLVSCFTSGFGGRQEIILYLIFGLGSVLSGIRVMPRAAAAAPVPAPHPDHAHRLADGVA